MSNKVNTIVMAVSLVAAGFSAFFAWRISTLEEINQLRSHLVKLERQIPESYMQQISEIVKSTLPSDLMRQDKVYDH